MHLLRKSLLTVAVYLTVPIGTATALPCAGASSFADVPANANYCTDVEWLKNRSITLGCGAMLYCPNDFVTRGAMALFMQRLGTALSPQLFHVLASTGTFDLDAPPYNILCQTGDFVVSGYPRAAMIISTVSGFATGLLAYQQVLDFSTDGGATWAPIGNAVLPHGIGAAGYVTSTLHGTQSLDVGTTYRWGTRMTRFGGTAEFSALRCLMDVQVFHRTGASPPFDGMPPQGGH